MTTTDPARELKMSRLYRAPRDLVMKMWSDPAHLTNWWGPFGFSTTTHEMDFRPGGWWEFTMHGPDGTDYPNIIKFIETGPDRIVYDHGCDGETVDFHVIVTFEEAEPGKTQMEFRMIFPTAEERQRMVETYRADKGLLETTTRLDSILADKMADLEPFKMHISLPSETAIRTVRSFRAPRQLVFEAFTDARHISRWQGPAIYKITECLLEARTGGKWETKCQGPDGHEFRYGGDILEFDPPSRVVSTFVMEGFECYPQHNITLFEEINDLTRVTITTDMGSKDARDGLLGSGMEWGMVEGYNRLEALLASNLETNQE